MRRPWLAALALAALSCGGNKGVVSSDDRASAPDGGRTATADAAVGGRPVGQDGDDTNDDAPVRRACTKECLDFPESPIFDPAERPAITSADVGKFSGDAFEPAAFCLMEPQLSSANTPGALFPSNWLRPRFRWEGGASDALYELKLESSVQRHALRAYTRGNEWTIPREIWQKSAATLGEVTVTIRALAADGKVTGVRGSFQVAPVEAGGSLVFWATNSSQVGQTTSKLHGFAVGDEAVIEALRVSDVMTTPMLHENGRDLRGEYSPRPGFSPGQVQCIGCHVGTPDGKAVVFTDDFPWPKVVSSIEEQSAGTTPSYVSKGAQTLLKQPWLGVQTMSGAHWRSGDRILVASYGTRAEPFSAQNGEKDRLVWFDLETTVQIPEQVPATSAPPPTRDDYRNMRNAAITAAKGKAWDTLTMTGEMHNAVTPSFSSDGKRIAYVSTDKSPNGHPAYEASVADVYLVPYNDRAGGAVTALAGASSADWLEYYPSFSPDDAFITFTRAPKKGPAPDGPYYNRNGEIYVVPSDGSREPVRLLANDPPACSKQTSPGVLNSWSKWSPRVRELDGKRYYFLVFSSARRHPLAFDIPRSQYTPPTLDTRSSQLYMAAFVVDQGGQVTSFPAIYLWNQNRLQEDGMTKETATSNLTPAWAEFDIPEVFVQ